MLPAVSRSATVAVALAAAVALVASCSPAHRPQPAAPPPPTSAPAPADTAVLTQKNDPTRTGWYSHERVLSPSTVDGSRFGRRTTYPVDGAVYAQPLFVPGLVVHGGSHNAVIV